MSDEGPSTISAGHPEALVSPTPISQDADVAAQPAGKMESEEEQKLAFFASAPLRSAHRLMGLLYTDDSFYETATFAWLGSEDARKLFLYGVCKEVMKACVGMMDDREHLRETPPAGDKPDQIEKVVLGAFSDMQTQRMRKLVELLSLLILFDRRAKRDEEYRVFLNAENLDLALSQLEDFSELYDGRVIANTQHSVIGFADRIHNDLKMLGVDTLWFLDRQKLTRLKPSVFVSRKKLYLDALLVASADERLALGVSYGRGYSSHSQAVHPLLGSQDYGEKENTVRSLRAAYGQTALLAMHVMHLAFRLAGQEDPGGLGKVMGKDFEKSAAMEVMRGMQRDIEVGDLILTAWTDLAEVLEVCTGKYGYKACRIRYLSRPPLLETPEDWIESQRVLIQLTSRSQMRAILEKAVTSEDTPKEVRDIMPELLKQPEDQLMESTRKLFLKFHEANALIPMLIEQGHLKQRIPE